MLDRRDLLIDKLSSLAQVTVTKQADGTDTIAFGDAAKPLVEGTTVNWPQTLTSAAGGQLGALLALTGPAGPLTTFQTELDAVAAVGRLDRQRAAHLHAVLHRHHRGDARGRRERLRSADLLDRSARRQRRGARDRRPARRGGRTELLRR